jgi:dTMP kinase
VSRTGHPGGIGDVRGVLAIGPFRRLWLALGLSSLGDWLGLLALTSLAGSLASGGSPSAEYLAVSGVFILRLAPAILLGPLAGAIADRFSRRATMVVGDLLRFALFCSIPIVGTLWWLYVATLLIECVGLFWAPAQEATMPNLVPRERLEAANQLMLVATYGTAPLAALVFSGLTLVNTPLRYLFPQLDPQGDYLALYANALTFLVSAVVVFTLRFPPQHLERVRSQPLWRTIVEGWGFVVSTPLVRGLVTGMLGAFAAGGVVIGLAQRFVKELGAGAPGYGALFGSVFTGLAAGMWLGPRLLAGFSRRRLFGLALAPAGVFLIVLALIPNIVVAVLVTVALGACAGVSWVCGYTLLGLEVEDEVRGRTFAFIQSLVRVVLVTLLAVAPLLAAAFDGLLGLPVTVHAGRIDLTYTGAMATFFVAGVATIVSGVIAYRQMDDRKGVPLVTDLTDALRHHGSQAQAEPSPAAPAPAQPVPAEPAPATQPPDRPGALLPAADGEHPAHDSLPGLFIAFEGGDGAGKSTQARLLREWLEGRGRTVVVTREPGGTPAGQRIREVVLHGSHLAPRAEALLFAADRAHHVETVVLPALQRGDVVITDRYLDSSVAYQGAGRDLPADEVLQLSRWATQGLRPALTVLLDVSPEVGRQRRGDVHDRLESEPDAFHARVRRHYLELAAADPARYLVVDAGLPAEEIHRRVRERLSRLAEVGS